MSGVTKGDGTFRALRVLALILGSVLIVTSILAGFLGLSVGGGFSYNRIGMLGLGILLITAGILGKRFLPLYKGAAVMLLNVLLVLLVLDLACLVLVKIIDPGRFRERARKLEEGNAGVLDNGSVLGMYEPYVVWRTYPSFGCDTLSISSEGFRLVPGASPDPSAFRVFLFGGSTMWGWGAADSTTIGSFLQRRLSAELEGPVAVYNFAQPGFASTQEIIELVLQLRDGNVPDVAIFFDGYNDIANTYCSGIVGSHFQQGLVAARVEGRSEEFREPSIPGIVFRRSTLWQLMEALRGEPDAGEVSGPEEAVTYRTLGLDGDSLVTALVTAYFGNCSIVRSMADDYGFDCFFVWQPCMIMDLDSLSSGAADAGKSDATLAWEEFVNDSYGLFERNRPDTVEYRLFTGIFDRPGDAFIDDISGVHLSRAGNEAVASELADLVLSVRRIGVPAPDSLAGSP